MNEIGKVTSHYRSLKHYFIRTEFYVKNEINLRFKKVYN